MPITTVEYAAFQQAYDFFNRELFADSLPPILVTLQRKSSAFGYFSPDRFNSRQRTESAHEIALNPDHFGRTDQEILSTLVHEMAHTWQQEHGTPGRGRYHNQEWAAKMIALGLHPSDTGQPGGKTTGDRVSHYIVDGGPYAVAVAKLLGTGFVLNWKSTEPIPAQRVAKAASKTKYSCPDCGLNAWAKPDQQLICGECYDGGDGEIRHLEQLD